MNKSIYPSDVSPSVYNTDISPSQKSPPAKGEWEERPKIIWDNPNGFTEKEIRIFISSLRSQAYKEGRREAIEEVKALIISYKSYYNPINDERNKGKHEAMDSLLSHIYALKNT